MEYSFDVDFAVENGVEEAVLYKNIMFWCQKNMANGRHFYDGRYWTYNSAQAFTELFPFWNKKKIERLLQSLVDKGIILKGEYNQNKYDRTLWYTPSENVVSISQKCRMETTDLSHRDPENVAPIPYINTDHKPNSKQSKPKPTKNKYGSFENVLLTDQELIKLYERFGESEARHRIEKLSLAIESKGYKYSSHYATILQWAMKESDSPVSIQEKPSNRIPNLWEKKL